MILKDSQKKKLRDAGIWIDYYTGHARICGWQFKSNNFLKMHEFPTRRKRDVKTSTAI
jgi:hypothetical protein